MVEHDCWQQLAAAKVAAWVAQAAKLQRIAESGFRGTGLGDGGEVIGAQRVVTDDLVFCVGQRQQRGALPLGHGNTRRHRSTSKNLLPYAIAMKEDYERIGSSRASLALPPCVDVRL